MVSDRDVQEDINYVNEFRNNIIRAMEVRFKIVQDKYAAINLLKQNLQDRNGHSLLKRTIKNERWFLRIIERGLGNSYSRLKEIYSWISKKCKDKEIKNNVKRLVEIVEIFYSNYRQIDKRLQLEESFLEKQDWESFDKFLYEWENDFKIRSKIIKKIVRARDLVIFFKKKKYALMSAVSGGIGGAVGSLTTTQLGLFGPLTIQETALTIGIFTLFSTVAYTLYDLATTEIPHMDEYVKLAEKVRKARIQARRAKW